MSLKIIIFFQTEVLRIAEFISEVIPPPLNLSGSTGVISSYLIFQISEFCRGEGGGSGH